MKLLIAEDTLTQRLILEAITRKAGFEPVMAEDGQQALDLLLAENAPQLVILDWEMPKLNGPDVCKRINTERTTPPYIILLTSRTNTTDLVAGLDSGASDYVKKPFDTAELLARLQVGRRMLELRSQLLATQEALAYQATHDELTGLLNRRTLLDTFKRELARAQRQNFDLHICLCDLDHFKKINDTHGHLAGDAVLKESAKRIQSQLRPFDVIARYGGEEFLILMSCDTNQSHKIFERVRETIASTPFIFEDKKLSVTISGGVTSLSTDGTRSIEKLLADADTALYRAKETGRNRIEYF